MREGVLLRDTTLPNIASDDFRQVEIVATGLPWARGVPLACDATLVSPLHADGSEWRYADETDGVAITRAEEAKRVTYHDLVASSRCRLVVLACEVGGRWSDTCVAFVRKCAALRAQGAPPLLRVAAQAAWAARWWAMLGVAQQTTLAATLVEPSFPTLDALAGEAPPLADVLLEGEPPPLPSRLPG